LPHALAGYGSTVSPRSRRPAAALAEARHDAAGCRRCDLWRSATQVVFGEGTTRARAMLVGEQPGDAEDEEGRPFVGPAGLLLRRVLEEVGLDERDLYLTNAVKHFKWRPKGTRRIHDTPNWTEIRACDLWLRLELAEVAPELVVCLGATATHALLGRSAKVTVLRGRVLEPPELAVPAIVTLHPSAVLRAGDRRDERHAELTHDLALVRTTLEELRTKGVATAARG
jgi:DNA polymerase